MLAGSRSTPVWRGALTSSLFQRSRSSTRVSVGRSRLARPPAATSASSWRRQARAEGGGYVTSGDQQANREARLGGVGAQVAAEVERRTGKEARAMVLGHLQRGGGPTNFDRALCTLFGVSAVELAAAGEFGRMV